MIKFRKNDIIRALREEKRLHKPDGKFGTYKKNRGYFPLLQRIWSGDMNVAKEEPFPPVVPMTVKE